MPGRPVWSRASASLIAITLLMPSRVAHSSRPLNWLTWRVGRLLGDPAGFGERPWWRYVVPTVGAEGVAVPWFAEGVVAFLVAAHSLHP